MPGTVARLRLSLAMVCAPAGVLYVLVGRGLRGAAVVGLSALAFEWVEIASLATADSAALCAALDPRFNVDIPLPASAPQPAGPTPSAEPGTGIDVSL